MPLPGRVPSADRELSRALPRHKKIRVLQCHRGFHGWTCQGPELNFYVTRLSPKRKCRPAIRCSSPASPPVSRPGSTRRPSPATVATRGPSPPPGRRQRRGHLAGSGHRERCRHHPRISGSRHGEGADSAGEPIERWGLQCGGDSASADQEHESGSSGEYAPPGHRAPCGRSGRKPGGIATWRLPASGLHDGSSRVVPGALCCAHTSSPHDLQMSVVP